MDNTNQSLFSSEALEKLNHTLSQYQVSKITTIPVPEFRGLPNEDVYEFLKKFKTATLSFDDKVKCVALNKALVGPAHTWAKENLKTLIAQEDWKAAKKAIIDRFALPNQELRHQEKLSKLKFDPQDHTLMSYVEEYADTYKKAHKQSKDQDIIRSLSLNLPGDILKNLNIISENWCELDSLKSFYQLVRRLESKILPYEGADESEGEKANMASLTKMLKDIQNSITQEKAKQSESKAQESVAAIAPRSPEPKRVRFNGQTASYPRFQNRGYRPYSGREERQSYTKTPNMYYRQNFPRMLPKSSEDDQNTAKNKALHEGYYSMYGKPPNPCHTCGGDHFNRHCPYRELNLN